MSGPISYVWNVTCDHCHETYRERGYGISWALQDGSLIECPKCNHKFPLRRDVNAVRLCRAADEWKHPV